MSIIIWKDINNNFYRDWLQAGPARDSGPHENNFYRAIPRAGESFS